MSKFWVIHLPGNGYSEPLTIAMVEAGVKAGKWTWLDYAWAPDFGASCLRLCQIKDFKHLLPPEPDREWLRKLLTASSQVSEQMKKEEPRQDHSAPGKISSRSDPHADDLVENYFPTFAKAIQRLIPVPPSGQSKSTPRLDPRPERSMERTTARPMERPGKPKEIEIEIDRSKTLPPREIPAEIVIENTHPDDIRLQIGGSDSTATLPVQEIPFDARLPGDDWYVQINEARQGPLSLNQLVTLWKSGQVEDKSFVWKPGMLEWKPIRSLPAFREAGEHTRTEYTSAAGPRQPGAERRRHERNPFIASVNFRLGLELLSGVCQDISVSGMQIVISDCEIKSGTVISLDVQPGEKTELAPFVVNARVIRKRKDKSGFAVEFVDLDPISSRALRTMAARLRKAREAAKQNKD